MTQGRASTPTNKSTQPSEPGGDAVTQRGTGAAQLRRHAQSWAVPIAPAIGCGGESPPSTARHSPHRLPQPGRRYSMPIARTFGGAV